MIRSVRMCKDVQGEAMCLEQHGTSWNRAAYRGRGQTENPSGGACEYPCCLRPFTQVHFAEPVEYSNSSLCMV